MGKIEDVPHGNPLKELKLFFSHNSLAGLVFKIGLIMVVWAGSLLAAEPDIAPSSVSVSADSVFVQMTKAWQEGDEKAMAALVHRDGLRVTHGGDYDRFTTYSPDQAFYYFQDLFQSCETQDFLFRRLPDSPDGSRGQGMVEWTFLRPERQFPEVSKLVVVLLKQDLQWCLAEFNSISQR